MVNTGVIIFLIIIIVIVFIIFLTFERDKDLDSNVKGFSGILSVFIILMLVYAIYTFLDNNGGGSGNGGENINQEIQKYLNEVPNLTSWSPNLSDVPNGTRNNCSVYTFPGTMNGDVAVPGKPVLNKEILDRLTPTELVPGQCYDPDQIVAKQQQRTCVGPNKCLDSKGNLVDVGQSEILYTQCSTEECKNSTLALLAFNFNENNPGNNICLELGTSGNIIGSKCDISNPGQLWKVSRAEALTLKPNQNGPYAQFLNRAKEQCLSVSDGNNTLATTECGSTDGIVWFLSSPFQDLTTITPQQISYVPKGDVTALQFPSYVNSNNVLSITPNPNNNSEIILAPFSNGSNTTTSELYNSQYIDYALYNLISQTPTYSPGNPSFPYGNSLV